MTTPNDLPSVGTEHTPGKLYVRGGFSLYAEDKKTPVADACLNASLATHDEGNARRLAACWNALEGVPTEEIESVLIHGKAIKDVVSERDELAARVRELEGERDQAMRNRDMWKGQCERQAEQLTALRVHPHASEAITWTPETGYVYADDALTNTPESKP